MEKAKVYFTKELTPEAMERMYRVLGSRLSGETAVKVHSGEMGNQNFIRPDFMKKVIEAVNGTVVECNTAYEGKRNTTKEHWETMKAHGWTEHFRVDIMDEDGELELPVEGGKQISVNYVGKNLQNYDSILVLSHFKGHPMGGFGGALKNISIGIASSHGKAHIHGAGHPEAMWTADHDSFLEAMADAAKSIVAQLHSGHAYNFPCKVSVKHFILNTQKRTGKHTIIVYLPVLLFSSIIRFQATASISPTLQTQKAQPRNHNGIPIRPGRTPPYAAIRLRLMGHTPFSLQPVLQKPASFRQGRLYRRAGVVHDIELLLTAYRFHSQGKKILRSRLCTGRCAGLKDTGKHGKNLAHAG